jgi:hypothetical protein
LAICLRQVKSGSALKPWMAQRPREAIFFGSQVHMVFTVLLLL